MNLNSELLTNTSTNSHGVMVPSILSKRFLLVLIRASRMI